jgi:carbon monoxide dehydrogenase subunit G
MRLHGGHVFHVPREAIWACVFDPARLGRVLPGCERFEQTGPATYALALRINLPLLKGLYQGTIEVVDSTVPARLALRVRGTGPVGSVRGDGTFVLDALPPTMEGQQRPAVAGTSLTYDGNVEFGGMLRLLGAQAISPAARAVIERFFQRLEAEILAHEGSRAAGGPPEPAEPAPPGGA